MSYVEIVLQTCKELTMELMVATYPGLVECHFEPDVERLGYSGLGIRPWKSYRIRTYRPKDFITARSRFVWIMRTAFLAIDLLFNYWQVSTVPVYFTASNNLSVACQIHVVCTVH